jgi:hypothetical protein
MNYSTLTPDISALARDAMYDEPIDWNTIEIKDDTNDS